jgi:hypothetical protein
MAIPSRQIGQSTQANLLWQISKQLERLICVAGCGCSTTTTTTTIEPTTTTTTTALCNYLYEGVLTVGGDVRGSGYQSGVGSIDPIDANFSQLFYYATAENLSLSIITDCYSTIDVYINGTIYTLIPDLTPGSYSLEGIDNPFPPIGETCIIQICPGELCP